MRKRSLYLYGLAAVFIPVLSFIFLSSNDVSKVAPAVIEQPEAAGPDPAYRDFIAEFEQELEMEFERSGIPGAAVAILIDSTILTLKAMGLCSTHQPDSVDIHTAFRIASVSKGFAAVLTGLFVEEKLNWNDPIVDHIADFEVSPQAYADSITIKHILSHSAGYPYQAFSTLVEDGLKRDTLFSELQKIELSRKPGEIHSYQNVAYSLIEPVLEKVTHCSYHSLMHERIFTPLNMTDASISYHDMWANPNAALPHRRSMTGFKPVGLSRSYYNVAAAGGINASISDMAEWMKALMGLKPEVVPVTVLDSIFTPVIRTSVKNRSFSAFDRPRKGHYGLGWRIVEYPSDTLIYHGGYANGYKSEIALDRNKGIAICILTNSPGRFCNKMVVEFFKAYKRHFPEVISTDNATELIPPENT